MPKKYPPNQTPPEQAEYTPGKRVLAHLEGFTSGHITFKTGAWTHADVLERLPNDKYRVKLLTFPLGVDEAVLDRAHIETVAGETYEPR